jgi:signal transduction histidine kinase
VGYPITLGENHPFVVRAGPLALRRALRNLLLNAITHGKSASVRLISCGDRGSIFIDDIGPGIPEALMVRVFEPFFRVDAARQQAIPGAGLGLAIAKEIINRHGGVIKLTNNPAGGLTQCITFPRAPYVTST